MEELALFALPLAEDERDSEINGDDAGSSSAGDHVILDHIEGVRLEAEEAARQRGIGRKPENREALYIAVKDGREGVVESLLAQGANPDPAPSVRGLPLPTPISAAIGGKSIKIVALLAQHPRFDPTRKLDGLTYAQITEMRQGPNWEKEVGILERAYDRYKPAKIRGVNNATTGKLEPEIEESSKTPPKKQPEESTKPRTRGRTIVHYL